jgi:hypothetical protein
MEILVCTMLEPVLDPMFAINVSDVQGAILSQQFHMGIHRRGELSQLLQNPVCHSGVHHFFFSVIRIKTLRHELIFRPRH